MGEKVSQPQFAMDPAGGKRGARRGDILAAARRLFATRGHGRTTMAEIAETIGVAEGTVYLYFATKRELVVAVAVEWFLEIAEATEREAGAIRDPIDRLRFVIQRHLDVILSNPELYLTLIREVRAGPDYATSRGREVNRRYTGIAMSALKDAAKAKRGPGLDPGAMRDLVYGGVEQVAWTAIVQKRTDLDTAALARDLAGFYVRGLALGAAAPNDVEARLQRLEAALLPNPPPMPKKAPRIGPRKGSRP
ncbi:MAG: TetR/AcrR family transcriptional regulator [Alphaproteobacteria bacterium]|nr:TetR/AcrR family transcriptional regulator [Alphaproteobacteria bacterium]